MPQASLGIDWAAGDDLEMPGLFTWILSLLVALAGPQKALPADELALAIERVAALEVDPAAPVEALLDALDELAYHRKIRGQNRQLVSLLERMLELCAEHEPGSSPRTLLTMSRLGLTLGLLKDPGAVGLMEEAVELHRQEYGERDGRTTDAMANLGGVLLERGNYREARTIFEEVLQIDGELSGPGSAPVAAHLNNLGLICRELGDLQLARQYAEDSVLARMELFGPDDMVTWVSLNNLASIHLAAGEYEDAGLIHEELIDVAERIMPGHPTLANLYNDHGYLDLLRGNLKPARPLLERAAEIYARTLGEQHPFHATVLENLGLLFREQENFADAMGCFERALATRLSVLGPAHPDTITSQVHIGSILTVQGEVDSALEMLEGALANARKELGRDHGLTATVMSRHAMAMERQGDLEGARELCEAALAAKEQALGADHPECLNTVRTLAELYRRIGEPGLHRATLERLVEKRRSVLGAGHPRMQEITLDLTNSLWEAGELRDAWGLLQRSTREQRATRWGTLSSLSEPEAYKYVASTRHRAEAGVRLAQELGGYEEQITAYENWLDWKGRTSRVLVSSRQSWRSQLGEDDVDLVIELRQVQAELSRMVLERHMLKKEGRGARLELLRERRVQIEVEVRRRMHTPEWPVPDWSEVRRALQPGEALVDFLVSEHDVRAWITRPDASLLTIDLGAASTLEDAVEALLARLMRTTAPERGISVEASSETQTWESASERLFDLLWTRLAPHLAGVDQVFVRPDGFLGGLPLEVLTKDDRFLCESWSFVYGQDLEGMLSSKPEGSAAMGLLVVGDVDYGPGWAPLPATVAECRTILDLYEARSGAAPGVWLGGDQATTQRVSMKSPGMSNLHFATHAFFDAPDGRTDGSIEQQIASEIPALSVGLVLAPTPADDDLLTAEEVGWLDLAAADLVVLSACQSGVGQVQPGEGMIGLRRSFLLAGARTVVSSLWPVEDQATSDLMGDFYRNLWEQGLPKHEALNAARLKMLAENRMRFGDPRPWTFGAFVLSGSSR